MKEIWKEVTGYPNYMVSNMGRVKSIGRWIDKEYRGKRWQEEKILKPTVKQTGYLYVGLWKNGVKKFYRIHRLVAQTFIPNPNNLPQVNHKDENPSNNFVDNLEWCDAKYNNNYGTARERRIEKTSKPVLQINKTTNEVIAEFPSAIEVERQLGIHQSAISNCCNNKPHCNTAYGYKWQFKPTT